MQFRGGGVVRFRPDGSGLELFASGTRNILGTPASPLLDLFARDNTNDGGGWDVRFHHFTGLEDHGYPRLYKHFGQEIIQPLADYGGGSGCGSVYLHEPGFPEAWNHAPLTCDWGTGALWKHTVKRTGATFEEIGKPEPMVRMTRPTDADVDGMSALYQASWKGATFRWEGPDVGYIARVTPKGYTPEPFPAFESLSDAALVALLESPSHIRTLTAQRTLLRRPASPETTKTLLQLAGNSEKSLSARVAALYAVAQRAIDSSQSAAILEALLALPRDSDFEPFLYRALGDFGQDLITAGKPGPVGGGVFQEGLASENPRTVVEAMVGAARQGASDAGEAIAQHLGNDDPVVAHTAFQALARLGASQACFEILTGASTVKARQGAAHALMRMHEETVIDRLISLAGETSDPSIRRPVLAALCRLYHVEGKWKGDSWGTRPDTRGPYYQPETWEHSEKILAALRTVLESANPSEATFLVREMSRNRIQTDDALNRLLALAKDNREMLPEAIKQLAATDEIPAQGLELLEKAFADTSLPHAARADAVRALSKTDSATSFRFLWLP